MNGEKRKKNRRTTKMGKYAVQMYASDLDPSKRNDAFMGEGFEAKLKEAEEKECELIIGEFCPNNEWRLDD